MSKYKANKSDAVFFNTEPTKTDQSQASGTDINIIVTQFLRTGQMPNQAQPIYGDFSELPRDLRGFLELGRSIEENKRALPEQLKAIPVDRLVTMTRDEINAILAPPSEPTKEQA